MCGGTDFGPEKTIYTKREPTTKGHHTKYEPVAEQYAASAWNSLNQIPYFPQVANMVVPKEAYFSEKYDETVHEVAVQKKYTRFLHIYHWYLLRGLPRCSILLNRN
jgi:hypothetical protein